jgi:hypothetical protein
MQNFFIKNLHLYVVLAGISHTVLESETRKTDGVRFSDGSLHHVAQFQSARHAAWLTSEAHEYGH